MAKKKQVSDAKSAAKAKELPMFCDYHCPHAAFPPLDAVGACRREQAVWCGLFSAYNNKNASCLGRR
ncbi:MAG: hypothetical protein OEM41_00765 [Ignavibacteria bacterium]|nr:hypothetical protein [Ignavibacteria bacterium]